MPEWKQEVIRLRLQEHMPWKDIIERYRSTFPNNTDEQIRKRLGQTVSRSKEKNNLRKSETAGSNEYDKETGTQTYDKVISICEGEPITPELIMTLHGLKSSEWEVINYRNTFWHSQIKGGTRLVMYHSRLTVKPVSGKVTIESIDEYLSKKVYRKPALVKAEKYDPDGEVLEIDIADLHSGLLAWCRETGADYDVHIAQKRFMKVIDDVLFRCKKRHFRRIYLALLGDLLHIDNDLQTTTKGTFQQADGRIAKIYEITLDMLFDAIRLLGDVAPVEVVYTSGNHDGTSGWMLIKALQKSFTDDPNVTIDTEPNPQKVRLFGKSLIGFVHGDMPEKNLSGWLQVRAREMPVAIKFMEVHSGHRHAQKVKEIVQTEDAEGVVVRTMPTITNASTWEHRQGYAGATCTSMSFVWSEESGLREMWYCNM